MEESMTEIASQQAERDNNIRLLKQSIKINYLKICQLIHETMKTQGWRCAYDNPEEWAHQEHHISRRKLYNMNAIGSMTERLLAIEPQLFAPDNIDPSKLELIAPKLRKAKSDEEIKEIINDAKALSYSDIEKKYKKDILLNFTITGYVTHISKHGKTLTLGGVNFDYDASPDVISESVIGKEFKIKFIELPKKSKQYD